MEEVAAKKAARLKEKEEAQAEPSEEQSEPTPEPEPQAEAAPEQDLTKLTKKQLQELGAKFGAQFTSSTPKGDLVKIVQKAMEQQPPIPGTEETPEQEPAETETGKEEPKPDEGKKPTEDDGSFKLGGMEVVSVQESIDWFNGMIFGDPGVGKTFLAGTAADVPSMSPVLVIDIEGGTKTLRKRENIDVVRVKDLTRKKANGDIVIKRYAWQVLYDVYESLTVDKKYKTVVIDSASEAYEVLMAYVLADQYVKAEEKGRDKEENAPEQRDWGIARNMFKKFIKAMNDLDKNIIWTALPGELKDQQSGALKVGPSFPGKLFKEVPAKMNEVYYLYTKTDKDEVVRMLLTQPEGKYYAKTRSGDAAPLTLTNPTMAKICEFAVDHEQGKETK